MGRRSRQPVEEEYEEEEEVQEEDEEEEEDVEEEVVDAEENEEDDEEGEEEEDDEEEEEEEDEEEEWEYSKCTHNKKALFIGIRYLGQPGMLRGCHNDIDNLYKFITEKYDYPPDNIMMLRDDSEDPDLQPTKANILEAMKWLVEDAQTDDALFLHYSGHGGQQEDLDGDEADGHDEAIVPVDAAENGLIIDDVMNEILVKPLPIGCRLTVLFDACHSGSALDLPYTYDTNGAVTQASMQARKHSADALTAALKAHNEGDMDALAKATQALSMVTSGAADAAHKKTKKEKGSRADVIYLSGCKDHECSIDLPHESGESTGAVSMALEQVLTHSPEITYQELLEALQTILQDLGQIPQLSSSHPIDTDLQFII